MEFKFIADSDIGFSKEHIDKSMYWLRNSQTCQLDNDMVPHGEHWIIIPYYGTNENYIYYTSLNNSVILPPGERLLYVGFDTSWIKEEHIDYDENQEWYDYEKTPLEETMTLEGLEFFCIPHHYLYVPNSSDIRLYFYQKNFYLQNLKLSKKTFIIKKFKL